MICVPKFSSTQFAAPATEPITLAAAKSQCRLPSDLTDDDSDMTAYIQAAREYAERFCNRRFVTQTWDLRMDGFPDERAFAIPYGPLQSISSISYVDVAGATQTLATTVYGSDIYSFIPRVFLKVGQWWPATYQQPENAVTIRAVVGYGAYTAVPPAIVQAIKMIVEHFFEERSDITDISLVKVPKGADALLSQHKASWV